MTGTTSWWDQRGDVAQRERSQDACQKLYVDPKGYFALGITGLYDESARNLLKEILSGKINLRAAIKAGELKQLAQINNDRFGGKIWDPEAVTSMLAVTRGPRGHTPELYTFWPLGKIEGRLWTSIGSGSKYASDYIVEQLKQQKPVDLTGSEDVSVQRGIVVGTGAINHASRDIYTGGLDLVVARNDRITRYGDEIREELSGAENRVMERILKKENSASNQ